MAEEIMEGVSPTRMDLLEIRKKLVLADKGHKLLEEKRDALVEKFFDVIDKRNELKKQVDTALEQAFQALIEAQMILGEEEVEQISFLTQDSGEISFDSDNIMGVKIPMMNTDHIHLMSTPLYGFSETCPRMDDAQRQFSTVLSQLLELAQVESSVNSLSVEIEKTKRRVNVLENTLIPKLHGTIKYIEMQLEEREREDFFRRKRIKALMEAKKELA